MAAADAMRKSSSFRRTVPSRRVKGVMKTGVSTMIPQSARNESWNEMSNSAGGARARITRRGEHERMDRVHLPFDDQRQDVDRDHDDRTGGRRRCAGEEEVENDQREGEEQDEPAQVEVEEEKFGPARRGHQDLEHEQGDHPDVKAGDGEDVVDAGPAVGILDGPRDMPHVADEERPEYRPLGPRHVRVDERPDPVGDGVDRALEAIIHRFPDQDYLPGGLYESRGKDLFIGQIALVVEFPGQSVISRTSDPSRRTGPGRRSSRAPALSRW